MPNVLRTVAELDELPVGSVVMTLWDDGPLHAVMQKYSDGWFGFPSKTALYPLGTGSGLESVALLWRGDADEPGDLRTDLMTGGEVAAFLGVTRQRLHQLRTQHGGFPAPVFDSGGVRLWDPAAISTFKSGWARTSGRPRKDAGVDWHTHA